MNKFEECIDYIHISDQFTGPRPQDYECVGFVNAVELCTLFVKSMYIVLLVIH